MVKPIERLFDDEFGGEHVTGIEDDVALVGRRSAEQAEHRVLQLVHWEELIVAAVDHQRRLLDARHEVDWIHLGKGFLKFKAAADEENSLNAWLDGGKDRAHVRSPTEPDVSDFVVIEILARFYVIDGATEIL